MKVTNMFSISPTSFTIFIGFFAIFLSFPLVNAYGQGGEKDTNPCSNHDMKKILKKICYKEYFSKGNCFDKVYKKIDEMNGQDLLDGLRVMYYVCDK